MEKSSWKDVDTYINAFPEDVRDKLLQIREIIRSSVPEAEEHISYGMPAYKLHRKPLVYFAAFREHIGFYATPTGHEAFATELSAYKHGKGSVQFPLAKDLPLALIERIVRFRKSEQDTKARKQ